MSQRNRLAILFTAVRWCDWQLTLGGRVDGGGVADGSFCHRVAAAPHPVASRSHKNTLGLIGRSVVLLQVRHADMEIVRRSIGPFQGRVPSLHGGRESKLKVHPKGCRMCPVHLTRLTRVSAKQRYGYFPPGLSWTPTITAYILTGQADPEGEAVGLDDLSHVRGVVLVVHAGQVSSQLPALPQGLVPGHGLGQNLVRHVVVHLIVYGGLVVLLLGF